MPDWLERAGATDSENVENHPVQTHKERHLNKEEGEEEGQEKGQGLRHKSDLCIDDVQHPGTKR